MIADEHSLKQQQYPSENICQHISSGNPVVKHEKTHQPLQACRPMLRTDQDCKEVMKYFGKPGTAVLPKCKGKTYKPICSVELSQSKKKSKSNAIQVVCDMKPCRNNSMFVGFLNENTGLIEKEDWIRVASTRHLKQYLFQHMKTSKYASGYALIKCQSFHTNHEIKQTLFLPKIFPTKPFSKSKEHININIVLEDSLSRNHFYRMLPKTAATLRYILHSPSIKATVIDMEMMQSFSSYTLDNVRKLFSAGKHDKQTYGLEYLYQLFKNKHYTTLFQEDGCWFDRWGTLIYKDYKTQNIVGKANILKKWIKYKNILKEKKYNSFVDDYGLTFRICTVFQDMNLTNLYREPTTCYNGEYLASAYLRYARKYVDLLQTAQRPFFAYTHVRTAHESTGVRIASDDEELTKFVKHATKQQNTLTIVLSDHGAKNMAYSMETNQGRHEVFHPVLFMIIPENVAKHLGKNVMNALVVNQKRLATVEDLHFAMLSLLHQDQNNENGAKGLFAPISLNRTCDDIGLEINEALCQCDGWEKYVSNSSSQALWAAEVAVGNINNMIQNEHLKSSTSASRCQRYSGKRITRVRLRITNTHHVLSFGLVVKPLLMNVEEIFEVAVNFSIALTGGSNLTNFVRVSRYNPYSYCAEPGINHELCTCNGTAPLQFSDIINKAKHESSFTTKSETKMLDGPCLGLIKRSLQRLVLKTLWQDKLVTYEAFNNCSKVTYQLMFTSQKQFSTRLSKPVPISVEILPNTIIHVITLSNTWKSGMFIPRTEFKKRKL